LLLDQRRLNQKGKFRATTLIHFQLLHQGRKVYKIKTRGLRNPSGTALWPNGSPICTDHFFFSNDHTSLDHIPPSFSLIDHTLTSPPTMTHLPLLPTMTHPLPPTMTHPLTPTMTRLPLPPIITHLPLPLQNTHLSPSP